MTDKEAQSAKEQLKKDFKSQKLSGELWIGKFDFYPHKLTLIDEVTDKDDFPARGRLTLLLNFENMNLAQQIEAPPEAKSFEELLNEVMNQYQEKYMQEYDTDSDKDGLTDQQEQYFKTDPNNPDTDGDGYKDGEEVKNGFNPNGVN